VNTTASTARQTRRLGFSGPQVEALLVRDAADYLVEGRTVVVNPGSRPAVLAESPRSSIAPLASTVLVDARIERAELLLLLRVREEQPAGSIITEPGWSRLADVAPGFPRDIPLWRGPQDDLGSVAPAPAQLLGAGPAAEQRFTVRANLWYAPAGTDCRLHNLHEFIEVHTQVQGAGRMQKFRADDPATLYQDVQMSPGHTHEPFCSPAPDGWHYPWHQYRADTDCLWLALEYHAQHS
jgi:hypothetical protein